jgi:sugar phosphate isomerase/epimerase
MPQISFITANYVARVLNYNGDPNWDTHETATVRTIDGPMFDAIANDIAAAGFESVDIWKAHCHYDFHADTDYLEVVKGICSAYDFTITSYAGGITARHPSDLDAPFRFMKQLGAPIFAGGIFGPLSAHELMPHIQAVCERYDVRYAFENHPEKTIDEILSAIAHGKYSRCGIALDTGWCATHRIDALEAAKRLRDHLTIVHLKDIRKAGQHETCALGEGIVPVEAVTQWLAKDRWNGTLTIEHEPYDHDPTPEIERSLTRASAWAKG